MSKFIRLNYKDEDQQPRFLDLEKISFIDVVDKKVWTIEADGDKGTNNYYTISDENPAWDLILAYVEENMYVPKCGVPL